MNQFSSDFPWLPCRLFGEHRGICIPRVDFKDSTASLKCCPSEYVKKNSVWQFFSDFWRFSIEKWDFYVFMTQCSRNNRHGYEWACPFNELNGSFSSQHRLWTHPFDNVLLFKIRIQDPYYNPQATLVKRGLHLHIMHWDARLTPSIICKSLFKG